HPCTASSRAFGNAPTASPELRRLSDSRCRRPESACRCGAQPVAPARSRAARRRYVPGRCIARCRVPSSSIEETPAWFRLRESRSEFEHLLELVARVDVKKGKWKRPRIKRLAGEVHEYARILADRVEQHRIPELRNGLAQNVNRFAFELPKMSPLFVHAYFERGLKPATTCSPHSFVLDSHHHRPARLSSPG